MDFRRPFEGSDRRLRTAERRDAATKTEHATFPEAEVVQTPVNADEVTFETEAFGPTFTKGLRHDAFGFVTGGTDAFREDINGPAATDFSASDPGIAPGEFDSVLNDGGQKPNWRGWESPRTGHYHDVEGADADAIGMAPAPALGMTEESPSNAELAAEMAEVYAMAILRDVPFTQITKGADADVIKGSDPMTALGVEDALKALNAVPHFAANVGADSMFTRRRLAARFQDPNLYDINDPPAAGEITGENIFRGSGPGAKAGPYISQFMLIGNGGLGKGNDADPMDGYIAYGNQVIDQRVRVFAPQLDYMTNWFQWRDVQNGARMNGQHCLARDRRFITTPRDLATYVRFDALYQAYLNACLIMIGPGSGVGTQNGFPDRNDLARTPFASFGGPHILSLVTEVATRCLKAARRQKFNYHRRARPERISGLLTVGAAVGGSLTGGDIPAALADGTATKRAVDSLLDHLSQTGGGPDDGMLDLVRHHNALREGNNERPFSSPGNDETGWLTNSANLLLAMAFPEGSPMHPAYAAGHATVAGGCVTMLKAFFKTVTGSGHPIKWTGVGLPAAVPTHDGQGLTREGFDASDMTLEGELNKLAANISIGRNMAGVHYYSDYYDSLRMGERIAVSILIEQLYGYDEKVEMVFRSYDGDLIKLSTPGDGTVSKEIRSSYHGTPVSYRDWWFRHMEEPGGAAAAQAKYVA